MRKHRFRDFLALLLLTAIAVGFTSGCATNPVSGTPNVVFMSESTEIGIGEKNDPSIRKKYGVYNNAELQAYIDSIGQKLAAQSHRPNLKYHFTALDSPEVNAFALPGGYIYVTRGILAYLNSEAELAAVLGHEIGHVTARHGVRQHSAATATGIVGSIIGIATGVQVTQDLFSVLGNAMLSGYGREHELESDRLGAEYVARAGYDPQAIINVLGILKNQEEFEKKRAAAENRPPRIYHGVFASHPSSDRRLQEVVGQADKFKTIAEPKLAREEYLKRIENLPFGDASKSGVRRGNQYLHRELNFAFDIPEDWAIEYDSYYLLRLVNRDKMATLQIESATRAEEVTAMDFLKARMSAPSFDQAGPVKNLALKSYAGIVPESPESGTVKTRAAVVQLDNRFILFQGTVKEPGAFAINDPLFLAIIRSLRAQTDREKLLAGGPRLRLVQAKAGDSFASLAKRYTLGEDSEFILRLINGRYPIGEPKSGELIKIVE